MRFARGALVAALTVVMLCAAASAQTLRPESDPRNLAPTLGTGGPVGGPTGLFTIYDGQTLRRGEFTFSFGYSNYDRDPGNVDITEVPLSFQVGLSDYLELFFNTDAYRGIKVNNPRNLSSFYLPNSRFFNLPAIVLAPTGPNVGTQIAASGALYRPPSSQPFVPFPFVGGSCGTFGLAPGPTGGTYGFPGFNAQIGTPTGGQSNYGAAANFPCLGSVYGSILPGVVLRNGPVSSTVPGGQPTVDGPITYTVPPAYLPDAPFINRLYGESAFSTFVIGAKIRLTGPNNPLGFGFIPFYRFYADKANDAAGFNQLQRGASPGGNVGDFGVIFFMDGRVSRSVNISVNLGYILNSNPRSDALNKAALLDRPDELIAGVGFDFPVNKYFQPIAELRSTQYVGGRTPNAFENSPVDGLVGVRIFPARYMGFSAAYRRHLNQQDQSHFSQTLPSGFTPSDDPNGYLFQFFIGRRNERAPEYLPNQPPTVSVTANPTSITVCPRDPSQANPPDSRVQLSASATDPDGDTLLYSWTVTAGKIVGEGPNVTWDLSGVQPGTYTANVEVDDGCGCVAFASTSVTVSECPAPTPTPTPACPTISVSCPTEPVQAGQPITFTANVQGAPEGRTLTYNWTVSAGTITSGQGTPTIQVDTTGLGGQTVTATVEIGGLDASCTSTASCSASVVQPPQASKFDEYGNIAFNDEKARLDNFAIQLQNQPGAQGYIIAYGGRRGRVGEALRRAERAKNYLVSTRGIEAGRIVTVDGGYRETLTVELWIVPQGAQPPQATPTLTPEEAQPRPAAPARRAPRRRPRRR
ncbi:MAG: hypothetical protein IRZ19_08955 [Pyrinomonas methylaliphatogenes]|nr:hypothetical protein [Pyrinomonas methylaliphatogenes]